MVVTGDMKMSNANLTVADLRAQAEKYRALAADLDDRAARAESAFEGIDGVMNGSVSVSVAEPKRRGPKPKAKAVATASGKKRGRPPGAKNKPKDGTAVTAVTADAVDGDKVDGRLRGKTSLKELIGTVLKRNRSGLTLPEIVKECLAEGYKSQTSGSFSQIVYQNLYKLMKDEHSVEKNKETKKYKLVHKAA
jgi:hypothetical protein